MNNDKEVNWRDLRDRDVVEQTRLKPVTKNHGVYFKAIETSTITICTGPPGTGKTYMACGIGAQMLLEDRVNHVVLTRPLVQCKTRKTDGLGFLPGDVNEKITPYMRALLDAFDDFLSPNEFEKFVRDGRIEMRPLELLRGASIKGGFVICDEAQNAEYEQLHMLLTRIDHKTRMVITGDANQTDLACDGLNPLQRVVRRLTRPDRHPDISVVRLTAEDVMRPAIVQWIDERLTRVKR